MSLLFRRELLFIFLITILLAVFLIFSPKVYADDCTQIGSGSACMYLQPSSSNVSPNSSFSVQVRANIKGESSLGVQANLSFPADKLEAVSIDWSQAAFNIAAQEDISAGLIKIGSGSIRAVTGDVLIATVNFKTKSVTGTANISFTSDSAVVSPPTSKDILVKKVTGVIQIGSGGSQSTTNPTPNSTTNSSNITSNNSTNSNTTSNNTYGNKNPANNSNSNNPGLAPRQGAMARAQASAKASVDATQVPLTVLNDGQQTGAGDTSSNSTANSESSKKDSDNFVVRFFKFIFGFFNRSY